MRHKLCDLGFVNELRKLRPKRFTPSAPNEFVYWYTRPEGGAFASNESLLAGAGASTGVDIGEGEKRLAYEGIGVVQALLAGAPSQMMMDEHELAFFLSAVRQALEQEVVQMRLMSATPKMEQMEAACTRQLDLLLADHPLQGTEAFAKLRAWLLETVRGPILLSLLRLLQFDLPRSRSRRR